MCVRMASSKTQSKVSEIVLETQNLFQTTDSISFVRQVSLKLGPLLLDKDGKPNELYKDLLSYFLYNYKNFSDSFISTLFQTALEENAITGVIRIAGTLEDRDVILSKRHEKVFVDSPLLYKLKELAKFVPEILSDGVRGTKAKNAVISNTVIVFLSQKGRSGGSRIRRKTRKTKQQKTIRSTRKINY